MDQKSSKNLKIYEQIASVMCPFLRRSYEYLGKVIIGLKKL